MGSKVGFGLFWLLGSDITFGMKKKEWHEATEFTQLLHGQITTTT